MHYKYTVVCLEDIRRYVGLMFFDKLAISYVIMMFVERVAEWLKRMTRDLGVWGSIPAALVMCRSLGQALNPHRLWPPSSNGYLVEREKNVVNGIKPLPLYAAWSAFSSGEMRQYTCEFHNQGR